MAATHVVTKNTKVKKKSASDFTLQDIEELGGQQSDYDLIGNMDAEEDDIMEDFDDADDDPKIQDDLKQLISKLGFGGLTTSGNEATDVKEKKKKTKKVLKESGTDVSDKKKKKTVVEPESPSDSKQKKEGKKSPDQSETVSKKKRNTDVDTVSSAQPDKVKKKDKKNKYKENVQDSEVSSSTSPANQIQQMIDSYKPRKYLLVKSGGKWHDNEAKVPTDFEELPGPLLTKMRTFATKLYEEDVALYNQQRQTNKKSETGWMKTVVSSGTISDKMAALTILMQDAPVHSLASLDTLINMVKKNSRRENIMAVDTLKELFQGDLLLDNRKLRSFEQHPFLQLEELSSGNRDSRDKRLVLWYFESLLKERYASFVQSLKTMLQDSVQASKKKSLDTIYELLVGKPEQEKTLLELIINKLGDPDVKLASRSAHLLTKLVDKHPRMNGVVVKEVEQLLYRPNINVKAQYYAICFLNQLILHQSDCDLAAHLIAVYFSFFKAFVKKGEVDSKMLSALLSGVNRAYPYAKLDREKIEEQMTTLYKVVHIVNFNVSVQALMLLYQVMDSSDEISDRYYTALYGKLLDPGLKTSSKHALFLNVMFKSMKKDTVNKRVKAFIKRLLQVSSFQSPSFICAVLILVSEVLKSQKGLIKLNHTAEDSDDEEHFTDAKDEEDTRFDSDDSDKETKTTDHKAGSWVHRSLTDKSKTGDYDPRHRNPLYCQAELDCEWELERLSHHFHPSVALFANTILKGDSISYSSDPLQDFTLIRFLDRFVYRNPKKKSSEESHVSAMQPKRKRVHPKGARQLPVNSDAYIGKAEDTIPEEEKFFYKYFSQKAAKKEANKVEDFDSDAGSISDDDFDSYLEKYETGMEEAADIQFGVDFAREFTKEQGKKNKKDDMIDEDESDNDDVDDNLSDEEPDFDDDFGAAFTAADDDDPGFDEEDIEFSGDDDLEEFSSSKKKGKKTKKAQVNELVESDLSDFEAEPVAKKAKKTGKSKTSGDEQLFASAEEFAHLLDENTNSKIDMTGSQAMANKDNADVKQLKWEANRDRWLNDRDWKSKKRSKGGFKSTKGGFKAKKGGKPGGKKSNRR